jgi:hypothetical protein
MTRSHHQACALCGHYEHRRLKPVDRAVGAMGPPALPGWLASRAQATIGCKRGVRRDAVTTSLCG